MTSLENATIAMHEIFIELISAGFTETQALELVVKLMRGQNDSA